VEARAVALGGLVEAREVLEVQEEVLKACNEPWEVHTACEVWEEVLAAKFNGSVKNSKHL